MKYSSPNKPEALYFKYFMIFVLAFVFSGQKIIAVDIKRNPNTVYFPLLIHPVSTQERINDTRFGIGLTSYDDSTNIRDIETAGAGWLRSDQMSIRWSDFEPDRANQYDVSDANAGGEHMRSVEQQILYANARKFQVIQTINSAPRWALPTGNGNCGPIKTEHFAAFAQFVEKIVKKYSQPPYNIKHWEIFSQPDKYANLGNREKYDCHWVDFTDSTYFGGRKYGDMLSLVGANIKSADPSSKLIAGSLEADCRSTYGDLDEELTKMCVVGKFLTGMWMSDAPKWIDYIAIDAHDKFDAFDNVEGHYNNAVNWHNGWFRGLNEVGPTIIQKSNYLRIIMRQTGAGLVKPIINMRAALRCKFQNYNWKYAPCESLWDLPNFDRTKAYYTAQVNAAGLANNVVISIWDTATDHSGNRTELFDEKGNLSYWAWRESIFQLHQAQFLKEDGNNKNIKKYEFSRPNDQLLVTWAMRDAPVTLVLTQTVISITDALGVQLSPTQMISVTVKPLYIAFR